MEFQRLTDFLDSLEEKGIPGCSFALLKDGEKVGMTVGFQPKESLKKFIEEHK